MQIGCDKVCVQDAKGGPVLTAGRQLHKQHVCTEVLLCTSWLYEAVLGRQHDVNATDEVSRRIHILQIQKSVFGRYTLCCWTVDVGTRDGLTETAIDEMFAQYHPLITPQYHPPISPTQ